MIPQIVPNTILFEQLTLELHIWQLATGLEDVENCPPSGLSASTSQWSTPGVSKLWLTGQNRLASIINPALDSLL